MNQVNNLISRWFDLGVRDVVEPSFKWMMSHPVISVFVALFLVFISVRKYL